MKYRNKQRTIARKTMEAKYFAASVAETCAISTLFALQSLQVLPDNAFIHLHVDNQAAVEAIRNGDRMESVRHIEAAYHYVRWLCTEEYLTVEYVPSKHNPADIFTKKAYAALIMKGAASFDTRPSIWNIRSAYRHCVNRQNTHRMYSISIGTIKGSRTSSSAHNNNPVSARSTNAAGTRKAKFVGLVELNDDHFVVNSCKDPIKCIICPSETIIHTMDVTYVNERHGTMTLCFI